MAYMQSRSPARNGFTWAQTTPATFAAALVTGIRISASALASAGSFWASTASISALQSARFFCNAAADRTGLVVTPTAPRSRPRSSSADSAESCHHFVLVFSMTQFRYVPLTISSGEVLDFYDVKCSKKVGQADSLPTLWQAIRRLH